MPRTSVVCRRLYRERLERLESCIQMSQRLHRERLERLEGLIHRQEQALAATTSKLKEVGELSKEFELKPRGRKSRRLPVLQQLAL